MRSRFHVIDIVWNLKSTFLEHSHYLSTNSRSFDDVTPLLHERKVSLPSLNSLMSQFNAIPHSRVLFVLSPYYYYYYYSVALQPGVGLGLLYNTPPGLSAPSSVSPFVYSHLSQVRGHVIQPSHFWSSSSSCSVQLSVQHLFWNCSVLHSFYVTKPSYALAFNEPNNIIIIIVIIIIIIIIIYLQTGPGAHPASSTMGTGSFSRAKQPERGVNNTPHLELRSKKQ